MNRSLSATRILLAARISLTRRLQLLAIAFVTSIRIVTSAYASEDIRIVSPANGAVVSAPDVNITIDVGNLQLVPGAQATKKVDLHIHYLLDVDPTPWLDGTRDIPTGDPNIVHSASTSHTFKSLKPGPHTVTIILTDANHLAIQPVVAQAVSFSVGAPSASRLPTTGSIPLAASQTIGLFGLAMIGVGLVIRKYTQRH